MAEEIFEEIFGEISGEILIGVDTRRTQISPPLIHNREAVVVEQIKMLTYRQLRTVNVEALIQSLRIACE